MHSDITHYRLAHVWVLFVPAGLSLLMPADFDDKATVTAVCPVLCPCWSFSIVACLSLCAAMAASASVVNLQYKCVVRTHHKARAVGLHWVLLRGSLSLAPRTGLCWLKLLVGLGSSMLLDLIWEYETDQFHHDSWMRHGVVFTRARGRELMADKPLICLYWCLPTHVQLPAWPAWQAALGLAFGGVSCHCTKSVRG